ncbi:hypothetical protein BO71DRAFT_87264 [Aspergillus ellipticus CBS 707.79]|uniref:Uncharacterized protein n=1 Tax=Aspergillus ellipticus CBS 707.79 TaxID=1448320 RepID=A0A319DUP7_9EURO|nr:hypothetical protein BO71DRAFT_87264 [Aspergillus ellipticus CBS 707.79]
MTFSNGGDWATWRDAQQSRVGEESVGSCFGSDWENKCAFSLPDFNFVSGSNLSFPNRRCFSGFQFFFFFFFFFFLFCILSSVQCPWSVRGKCWAVGGCSRGRLTWRTSDAHPRMED